MGVGPLRGYLLVLGAIFRTDVWTGVLVTSALSGVMLDRIKRVVAMRRHGTQLDDQSLLLVRVRIPDGS